MMKLVRTTVSDDQHVGFKDVKAWYEKNIHPDVLDTDNKDVYDCYEKGKFAGLFQFTAKGAQSFIKKIKPENIIDIATATSIYRPGPLTAKVDKLYIDAKNDPSSVKYEHPLVKRVLEKTYGCIIFQEQLMELGNVVGGLSLEECDKLRKVITKRSVSGASKAKEDALKLEKKFIEGAVKNGIQEHSARDLFEKMAYFSGYGFNQSVHSSEDINIYTSCGIISHVAKFNEVKKGDFVKSRDEKTGDDIFIEVIELHDHGMIELFEFEFDDGKKVRCSMNHKFRVKDGRMLPIREIIDQDLEVVVDTVTKAHPLEV